MSLQTSFCCPFLCRYVRFESSAITVGSEEASNQLSDDICSMDTRDWFQEKNRFIDPFQWRNIHHYCIDHSSCSHPIDSLAKVPPPFQVMLHGLSIELIQKVENSPVPMAPFKEANGPAAKPLSQLLSPIYRLYTLLSEVGPTRSVLANYSAHMITRRMVNRSQANEQRDMNCKAGLKNNIIIHCQYLLAPVQLGTVMSKSSTIAISMSAHGLRMETTRVMIIRSPEKVSGLRKKL